MSFDEFEEIFEVPGREEPSQSSAEKRGRSDDEEEEGSGEDRHYDTGWFTTDEEDLQIAAQQQFQEQCFLITSKEKITI